MGFFLLGLPLAALPIVSALHGTTIRCARPGESVTCTVRDTLALEPSRPFTPVIARSTRRTVVGRSGPREIGRVVVRDTDDLEHESIEVAYEDSLLLASRLQRFLVDRELTHLEDSLEEWPGGTVLGGLFLALLSVALLFGLRDSGRVELALSGPSEPRRLTVTRKFWGFTLSRRVLDVTGAYSVVIEVSGKDRGLPDAHAKVDLFGRLRVLAPQGDVFIPERYARGRRVHVQGALALRELLGLPPADDSTFAPWLTPPKVAKLGWTETVAIGVAYGVVLGLLLLRTASFVFGDDPLPLRATLDWMILGGAVIASILLMRWMRSLGY